MTRSDGMPPPSDADSLADDATHLFPSSHIEIKSGVSSRVSASNLFRSVLLLRERLATIAMISAPPTIMVRHRWIAVFGRESPLLGFQKRCKAERMEPHNFQSFGAVGNPTEPAQREPRNLSIQPYPPVSSSLTYMMYEALFLSGSIIPEPDSFPWFRVTGDSTDHPVFTSGSDLRGPIL
ncbi:hypothetical protein PDE_07376 [Penicillium oxalicum 114-2]|uniref:Uncharacterized protein n=1 Tax=Penicillium oxalicum (strain 114-2 / CGMCC 5302) TaxID=933388 RepID=S7ZUJ1_PENO1|nr:hypothetical protein PDE_07376 [Penicillium oxalicum 114-2]